MIYITGDTHGELHALTENRHLPDKPAFTAQDKLIVCGDFGFVFEVRRTNERYWDDDKLDYLEQFFPAEILFVSGNHENFDRLATYPQEERCGGTVRRIRKNIFLLQRGEVYVMEGKKFFTFGGAYSIDKAWRTPGKSWWPQELPSPEEYRHASENLQRHDNTFDYIITHTCPERAIYWMKKSPDRHDAELTGFLDWLYTTAHFRQWYFGHWHIDESLDDGKLIACYEKIYSLPDSA